LLENGHDKDFGEGYMYMYLKQSVVLEVLGKPTMKLRLVGLRPGSRIRDFPIRSRSGTHLTATLYVGYLTTVHTEYTEM
jgi:hypothetical protein